MILKQMKISKNKIRIRLKLKSPNNQKNKFMKNYKKICAIRKLTRVITLKKKMKEKKRNKPKIVKVNLKIMRKYNLHSNKWILL